MARAKLDYEVPIHLRGEFLFRTAGILPPNGLLFGFNTIYKLGEQAKNLGGKGILLVTDETYGAVRLRRNGQGAPEKGRDEG